MSKYHLDYVECAANTITLLWPDNYRSWQIDTNYKLFWISLILHLWNTDALVAAKSHDCFATVDDIWDLTAHKYGSED